MHHYLYAMKADARDPVNTGDTKSWFSYYKVDNGETFVPTRNPEALSLKKGDMLWFSMDSEIIGAAVIVKDVTDVPPGAEAGKYEIWYDSDAIKKNVSTTTFATEREEGLLPEIISSPLMLLIGSS